MAIRLQQRAPTASGEFTVTVIPTSPQVGEATTILIEGAGPHVVSNELRDIALVTDLDNTGATFRHATSKDAETAPGRVIGTSWSSAGTKTLTISSYVFGEVVKTQQVNVTVTDPDVFAWNKTYWVDLTGDSTDMPADDSSNERILSYAAYTAIPEGNNSLSWRVRFRSGTTHNFVPVSTNYRKTWKAGLLRLDTFGGTAAAELDCTAATTGASNELVRISDVDDCVVIADNLKFVGPWDSISGSFNGGGYIKPFSASNSYLRGRWSLNRVEGHGVEQLLNIGGSTSDTRQCFVDCLFKDFMDFGTHLSGHHESVAIRGCKFDQSPLAGNHTDDGKSYNDPEWGNHGPIRIAAHYRVGVVQCEAANNCGWSGLGGFDNAIQPFVRVYCNAIGQKAGGWSNILDNDYTGRYLVQLGRPDVNDEITHGTKCLISGNNMNFNHQSGQLIEANGIGGTYVMNNVCYRPGLSMARNAMTYDILRQINQATTGGNDVPASIWQEPNYVGFNTYLSDQNDTLYTHGQQGATDIYSWRYSGEIDIPVATDENNQISGDGHDGTTIAASAFARGDNLRAITAGAADDSVTSAIPPLDFNGVVRTNPTNKGAHHATGADVAETAPSNSVAPTISASLRAPYVQISDLGTWAVNDELEKWMIERHWVLDAADAGGAQRSYSMVLDQTDLTGSLKCEVTMTNRSGTRVTVDSNTLTV